MAEKNGFAARRGGGFRGRVAGPGFRGRGGPRGRGGMARGRGGPHRGRGNARGGQSHRPAQHHSNAPHKDCTVLVRNLPSQAVDWQTKLTALFKDCGPMEKMEFLKTGNRDEGVFTFTQEDSVVKALAIHGSILEGRHIIVDVPEKNDQQYENTSIKVECAADVNEEDIWNLFEPCGTIKGIRVKHDNRKAHILFDSEEAVTAALAKNGTVLNEAPISVVRWRSWRACQEYSLGVAVFGLLHRASRDEVMEHFKDCGNICSVWVEFPRDSSIRRALIVFEEVSGAMKALEKDGTMLGKDNVRVRPWDGRKFINAVFVGGVPFGLAPTDLWKVFQTCGTIDNVHFDRFNQSYAARRACIEFEDQEGAKNALGLDGVEIKGKAIKVFSSLEEWDQHLVDYKEAKINKTGKPIKDEPYDNDEGDPEAELEGELEGEIEGEDINNGQDVEETEDGAHVDNGIKEEIEEDLQKGGKRKAGQPGQARGKARKLR